MAHEPLSLADAIDVIRGEIGKARIRAEVLGEEIRFNVGTVELEVLVQLTRGGKGENDVVLEVVEAGGSKGGDTHRITFPLTPVFEPRS
ncbi:trypco2 family protein [Sphaerisporangium perillae]|uniref:trypco2 family protein n=1 Tax=Sphaerisporangium perillae TaxID=2935860 RepID=UPI00200E0A32|nr:trypco2 family protein [Sphaerisporangium perillae]